MDTEMETKQIKMFFVYSDELKERVYRIQFDDSSEYPINSATSKETLHNFELINNEITKVKLKSRYTDPPQIVSREANMPIENAKIEFPFKKDGTYYLQIISGKSGLEINITDFKPTATHY